MIKASFMTQFNQYKVYRRTTANHFGLPLLGRQYLYYFPFFKFEKTTCTGFYVDLSIVTFRDPFIE